MGKLTGKVAVVTGAASGIGEATVTLFAAEGAQVVLVHHDTPKDAAKIIKAIEAAGGEGIAVSADVSDEADVTKVFAAAKKAYGGVTVLVNCAGVDAAGIPVDEMDPAHFRKVLETNLVGPFLFCRAFIKGLKSAKTKGKVINVTSVHEDLPRAGAGDYCASKGGLRNLTRCLALELAEIGSTAVNLAPGMVLTPMNQEAIDDPKKLEEQVQSIPLKRAASPEEVAQLALYLASEASDYASGSTFTLDGGVDNEHGPGRLKKGLNPEVVAQEPLSIARRNRLADMYLLSPFVWREPGEDGFHILLRAVPRRDDEPRLKMAEVWHGVSSDGLHFEMDMAPVIFPGPDLVDIDGCEDPTVVTGPGGLHVWYTGWNQKQEAGRLLLARGPDVTRLAKAGVALESRPPFANPKEAAVAPMAGGGWRMYFEYAHEGASLIGQAVADELDGPWRAVAQAPIQPRKDRFDDWHLSPGPILDLPGKKRLLIYNGATQGAKWRIGWAVFDSAFETVMERCDEPLVTPQALTGAATDIAFAASAIQADGEVWLYYSQSDQDLRRARITLG